MPYKIGFTGGEVTANKSFLPIVEYLQSGEFSIGELYVSTNGSASLNYYKKLVKLVNGITFSTHSEFFNEQDFFQKALEINQLMIRPEKSFHVNVMDEFWNKDRTIKYCELLTKNNDYTLSFKTLKNINEYSRNFLEECCKKYMIPIFYIENDTKKMFKKTDLYNKLELFLKSHNI